MINLSSIGGFIMRILAIVMTAFLALPAGSAVANMSLLGYDPHLFFTGRAPLEAAAQGIALGPDDWAVRCNLVTLEDGRMKSFTAGQVPNALASELIAMLQSDQCGNEHWKFHTGVSYRTIIPRPVLKG